MKKLRYTDTQIHRYTDTQIHKLSIFLNKTKQENLLLTHAVNNDMS